MSENVNYGMLRQGFEAKNLSKILSENIDMFKEIFGDDINTTSMNPLIKFNEVISRGIEEAWTQLMYYFDSGSMISADERFLRDLAIAMDLEVKPPFKATGILTFYKTGLSRVVIPEGAVIDNGVTGTTFLKEFESDERVELPAIFAVTMGVAGGTDNLNQNPGHTDFFDVESVEWVSDNLDGSDPYTGGGVDYTEVVDGGGYVTGLNWAAGGVEPVAGATYYVKVGAYKAYVDFTALETGQAYNAQLNEIYHMQSAITGIASVVNEEAIRNGADEESPLALRQRMLNSGFLLKNDNQMSAFLNQVHKIQSAKVYTMVYTGHFRSLVYPVETSDTGIISAFNDAIDRVEEMKPAGNHSVAIIRMIRGGVPATADVFPSPYSQVAGVSGTWQIDWVASNHDGSGTLYPNDGTSYDAYEEYDNEISWNGGGGGEPAGAAQYFVKLVKVVEIAETFPIEIDGRLTLKEGYDITTVNNDLFIILNNFIKTIGVSGDLYWSDLVKMILTHEGVTYVDNLLIRLTCRLWKGAAAGTDYLPLNGSGYSDSVNVDIQWINDDKDQGGTVYAIPADAIWNVSATVGQRGIDWSPGGAEATTQYPYWVQVEVKGDILTPDDVLLVLDGVEFTSA